MQRSGSRGEPWIVRIDRFDDHGIACFDAIEDIPLAQRLAVRRDDGQLVRQLVGAIEPEPGPIFLALDALEPALVGVGVNDSHRLYVARSAYRIPHANLHPVRVEHLGCGALDALAMINRYRIRLCAVEQAELDVVFMKGDVGDFGLVSILVLHRVAELHRLARFETRPFHAFRHEVPVDLVQDHLRKLWKRRPIRQTQALADRIERVEVVARDTPLQSRHKTNPSSISPFATSAAVRTTRISIARPVYSSCLIAPPGSAPRTRMPRRGGSAGG